MLLACGLGGILLGVFPLPGTPDPSLAEARQAQVLGALDRRIAALEARPAGAAVPDLGPLAARIAALESRPAPTAAPDLAQITGRIAALEGRPAAAAAPDLGPIAARIAALEARPVASPPPPVPDLGPLVARLAALEARPAGISPQQIAAIEATQGRLRAAAAIGAALAAGQPLAAPMRLLPAGTEPPAALAAFASTPPPTEIELRRDFPAAARAARAAPGEADADAMSAMQRFLGGLVTLRRGEEVVVGDADAAALATADTRLNEGNLAAAVAALAPLSSPAAKAMAPWKTRAEGLLAARRALLALTAS